MAQRLSSETAVRDVQEDREMGLDARSILKHAVEWTSQTALTPTL